MVFIRYRSPDDYFEKILFNNPLFLKKADDSFRKNGIV